MLLFRVFPTILNAFDFNPISYKHFSLSLFWECIVLPSNAFNNELYRAIISVFIWFIHFRIGIYFLFRYTIKRLLCFYSVCRKFIYILHCIELDRIWHSFWLSFSNRFATIASTIIKCDVFFRFKILSLRHSRHCFTRLVWHVR